MDDFTIFYSWQADAPARSNRNLIREAILSAISDPSLVVDSPRFESGMEQTAGTPEVATIMFEKILACSIFVGDVTLVGSIKTDVGGEEQVKKTPNPNVSLEMGFAAATIGWDRIICVMNEAACFGTREEQAFDVRNRRYPINYTLDPEQAKNENVWQKALHDLSQWMKIGIETVEQNELRKVQDVRKKLDIRCLDLLAELGPGFDSFPEPTATTVREHPALGKLDRGRFNAACVRLLELGVLFVNFSADRRDYAYHWTYLGKKLLVDLKLRRSPTPRGERGS